MSQYRDTPLSTVPGWTNDYVDKLAPNWITTAEQVVGIGATPGGVQSLAQQLEISEAKTQRLIDAAKDALPPATARVLSQQVDPSEQGMGALPPEEHKKARRR